MDDDTWLRKSPSRGEIFVVDDDPAVRDTLSMVLSAGGYQVICFADGAALLAVARTRTPACILLDVHIPGKSGLDILKELHGEDYPAPIFMISGQGDIAMAVSAIKNGALDFIEKPFRGSEIVARLDEAIERLCPPAGREFGLAHRHAAFPGTRTADAARARGAGAIHFRRVQQGSRTASRDQPAYDRGSPRQHHEEARRAKRRRSGPDRDDGLAPGLIFERSARIDAADAIAAASNDDVLFRSISRRSSAERLPDHDGHVRLAIGLGEQQHALIEPAVVDDRIFGIARGKQHLQPGLDLQDLVGELAAVEAGHDHVGEEQIEWLPRT